MGYKEPILAKLEISADKQQQKFVTAYNNYFGRFNEFAEQVMKIILNEYAKILLQELLNEINAIGKKTLERATEYGMAYIVLGIKETIILAKKYETDISCWDDEKKSLPNIIIQKVIQETSQLLEKVTEKGDREHAIIQMEMLGNTVTHIQDIEDLVTWQLNSPNIKKLDISFHRYNRSNPKVTLHVHKLISSFIKEQGEKTLESVKITSGVTAEEIKLIAPIINTISNLKTFELSYNSLKDEEVIPVMEELLKNNSLKTLEINEKIAASSAKYISQLLSTNQTIEELILWSESLTEDGGSAIGLGLKNNKTLKNLQLLGSKVGDTGAKHIGAALITSSLEKLNLYGNQISNIGLVELAKNLAQNPPLKSLMIGDRISGFEGVDALFNSLKSNNNLTSLSVTHFKLTDDELTKCLITLKNALQERKTPIKLKLCMSLKDVHMPLIAEMIASNHLIKKLDLSNNGKLTKEGFKPLADALLKNTTLTELDFGNTYILGLGGDKVLGTLLQNNKTLKYIHLLGTLVYEITDFSQCLDERHCLIADKYRESKSINFKFFEPVSNGNSQREVSDPEVIEIDPENTSTFK